MTTIEKRKHPRVAAEFPLRLGPLASAVVRDISRAGVRCITADPLSPMTVVGLRLELPTGRDGPDAWLDLECEGIVVRCRVLDEAEETRYESAILFKDPDPSTVQVISAFVERRLSSQGG